MIFDDVDYDDDKYNDVDNSNKPGICREYNNKNNKISQEQQHQTQKTA